MSVIFSDEQQFIIEKFKLGENIFITGPGGTGKSFLIKYLVSLAKKHINEVVDSVVSSKKKRKNWNNLDILIIDEHQCYFKIIRYY